MVQIAGYQNLTDFFAGEEARDQGMRLSTRLTAAMLALVLVTAMVVGSLTYRNVAELALPRALDRADTRARLLAIELEASVRGARADVLGFRASNAVIDIMTARLASGIDPTAGATEAEWRRRLALRFEAEMAVKPNYHEFRIVGLDDGGREIVRVDRSGPNGAVRTVPHAELQRKGDRESLKEAVSLRAGEVYVSRIDLNRDNGAIETPHVPVLRVATPLHAPDGRPFGIVIINVDMRQAFAAIRSVERDGGHIYVVNDLGHYLVHPDRQREFGFEFGSPARVQDDFPEFAEILARDDTAPRVVRDHAGARFGVGWETVRPAGGPSITVIEATPYAWLMTATTAIRNASLLGGLAAVLGGFVLAIILARSLTRPLVQMTRAVEGFARDELMAVPTAASGEIGVLARAFARMADDVREKAAVLKRALDERGLADEKFRLTVEASPNGVVMVDATGAIVLINAETEHLFIGYRTISTAGAAEALALVDGGAAFDLLFTDVIMSGTMNGRQLANEVAKRRPGVNVLFTSGYTENAIVHHGRLDAGVLLLAKPYRKSELARMIRTAIDAPLSVAGGRLGAGGTRVG
jgi:CheY-like chemotaxis protein